RHSGRPAVAGGAHRSDRPGHDHHRRCRCRRQFRGLRAAGPLHSRPQGRSPEFQGKRGMKILTANRLTDGEAVWFSTAHAWAETIVGAEIVSDKAGEARLEAVGKAALENNEVVDVNLIDVELVDGEIRPTRLREQIR